jgi:hypothetical protein
MTAARQPDPLTEAVGQIDELVHATVEHRRREVWTRSRHRRVLWDTYEFASLLDQLRELVAPTMQAVQDSVGHSVPRSRPAANLDAIDVLDRIGAGVRVWRYALNLAPRGTVDDDLQALVGAVAGRDEALRVAFARSVDGWWRRARTVCGWG